MNVDLKTFIKRLVPPFFADIFKKPRAYGFFGNYEKWDDALKDSRGYDSPEILEKVKTSLLKVKNGEAVYERDSVIFDTKQYSWPVLAAMLWIASMNDNRLNVLDFGGSLGSSYFQNIDFLKHLKELHWNIVEQENFVKCGKKYFENDQLRFYSKIQDCMRAQKPNVFFASSSIQYIEKPFEVLQEALGFEYVVFDRTTFLTNTERLTVQKVPPRIYDASYPAWFLNEEKFIDFFKTSYDLIAEFDSLAGNAIELGDMKGFEKGYIFKKK